MANHSAAVLLWLALLAGPVFGQINIPDEVEPHHSIVAGCNCVIPEGAEVRVIWRIRPLTPNAYSELIPAPNNQAYIWASPGQHEVTMTVAWKTFEIKKIGDQEIRSEKDWDLQQYEKAFLVTGNPAPNPNPNPQPTPTGFQAQVKAAFAKVPAVSRAAASKIAANYEAVAAEAAANSSSWDPAAMVNEVKVRHTTALTPAEIKDWGVFWPELAKALKALNLSATDLDGHVKAFHEIAAALNQPATKQIKATVPQKTKAKRVAYIPNNQRVVHASRN